jgi:hypothetical protein
MGTEFAVRDFVETGAARIQAQIIHRGEARLGEFLPRSITVVDQIEEAGEPSVDETLDPHSCIRNIKAPSFFSSRHGQRIP